MSGAWEDLHEGATAQFEFEITAQEHEAFARLSGDTSLIHTDDDFARARGFAGAITYGGSLLARLSRFVGMHLPGPNGVSLGWDVVFHSPLYVGERARFEGVVARLSPGTRTVKTRFRVTVGDRLIASGSAQSLVLDRPRQEG